MSYTLGISQYLYRNDICGITDYPFTWSGWVWVVNTSESYQWRTCFGFSSSTVDGADWAGQLVMAEDFTPLGLGGIHARTSPATESEFTGTATLGSGGWHHLCAVFTSSTSRTIYVDGVSGGTDATSIAFDAVQIDRTSFGAQLRGGQNTREFNQGGNVAEVALWDAVLGAADIALLAGGRYPDEVDTGNAVAYWPLLVHTRDQVASYHMTRMAGVSKSTAHPDMNSAGTPGKAYNPSPWNGTEEDGCFDFKLSWSDGGDTDTFEVYTGSSSGSLSSIASEITNPWYIGDGDDFPDDSAVYWRVDSTNDNGTTTGDEWTFDPQVGTATNPTPDTGAVSVSTTQSRLYWNGGNLYQTFDVYIDTVKVESDTTNEYYDLDDWASWPLDYETSYDWHVVSKNVHSSDTGTTWSFTTGVDVSASTDDDRPAAYDPDKVWDTATDTWKAVSAASVSGGGRYKSQIFVLGHKVIYFGDVS